MAGQRRKATMARSISDLAFRGRAVIALATLAVVIGVNSGYPQQNRTPPAGSESVTVVSGQIFAKIADRSAAGGVANIFLPNVSVQLRTLRGRQRVGNSVTTNVRGLFIAPNIAPGKYEVCWEADGFESGCTGSQRPIAVARTPVSAGPIEIRTTGNPVAGRVTPCFHQDPVFSIDINTKIVLVNAKDEAVTKPVVANQAGQFLVPRAPDGRLRVRVECGGAVPEAALQRERGRVTRLQFAPSSLQIKSVLATDGDRIVGKAKPGQTVRVAVDVAGAERSALQFRWFTGDSGIPFVSVDAAAIDWVLPERPGTNTMHVVGADERGGRRAARVSGATAGGPARFRRTRGPPCAADSQARQ